MAIDFKNSILYDDSDCPQGVTLKEWQKPIKVKGPIRKALHNLRRIGRT